MRKEIIIDGSDEEESLVFYYYNDKPREELNGKIAEFIYYVILTNLIILSQKYKEGDEDKILDDIEFVEEHVNYLSQHSIDFMENYYPKIKCFESELTKIKTLLENVFEANWMTKFIEKEKPWRKIREYSIIVLDGLNLANVNSIDDIEDKLSLEFLL